ncbi:serine/threonine protein kinase [Streptomyces sp. Ru73]|uniref:Stk1 family PASTA domain-containing Ser/Thr kinase n=1 Tax=Streptomyces sp. Ru73 TaxID=2080748 RepID=UPI000CDD434B|nr:Stk1 family PASTA domain-containing Ser/Thr kinase [Streptomyces sp. Ru73]POX40095.1 serine/threonine protein kinase [Streptomyces sp. Ru73]
MDTTLQDPLVGQLLDGRYRVQARIAAGGMATVYRAVDTRLDRVLALKVMHPSLAADASFVERFIREAKSVARLAHPNVVGVFDQGTDGTYVYLAMEYVAGCTLRDLLRERGALQPRAALDVLEPILAALGSAHRAGMVHRDMKPENVLIGDDGRVKVADFGLVRAVDTHTTASTGTVLGTVAYLAPEQIEDGSADTRADVYACGVTLYEMLTGSKPHDGGTAAQVLYQHLHEDVPAPSALVPGLPPELDDLVTEATARNPEVRPQDAVTLLALARNARAALTEEQLDAVPPGAKPASGTAGSEDRTSVIQRAAAVQLSLPGTDDVDADAAAGRTSRLEVPADARTDRLPTAGGAGRAETSRAPRRKALTVAIALLAALLLGTGAWYVTTGQFTTVPAVLDMTQPKAERTLHDAGLDVKVERAYSSTVERGHVISTDPENGKRIRGTGTVTITLSKGPDIVSVPDLSGTPVADARRKLRDKGLTPGTERTAFSNEVAKGSVIRTDPDAGTKRRPGTAVALTVSRGRALDVPDVVGDERADAAAELREAGFKVAFADRPVYSDEDKGAVARQSPGEGKKLGEGDTVTLTLSKGPQMVEVPDVEGQKAEDAKKTLEAAGFEVEVKKPLFFPSDTVKSQSVDAGDTAPKGSTLTIELDSKL